ncbi:hypothetical protein F4802DRAFT_609096 [Xylaria palmicola]|nr:hypothetical protein F4802DRAFT_609096 [Xylaria palmicola]
MSSSNGISVTLLCDEDIPTCFKILSESFGHDAPFVDSYFPNHDTLPGQVQGANRLSAWKRTTPESVFLKAVTSADGEATEKERIVGLAIWTHMKDIPSEELEAVEKAHEVWPDVNDRRFMARLWRDYVQPRTRAIRDSRGRGVYVLELLAIHPDYQGLGAGTALVTWGTKAADELRVTAVVESTPAGRRVYEKCGLRADIEEMVFDANGEFADRAKPKLIFMMREPVTEHN